MSFSLVTEFQTIGTHTYLLILKDDGILDTTERVSSFLFYCLVWGTNHYDNTKDKSSGYIIVIFS